MADLTLLAMPKAEFNDWVGEACKLYREGDLLALSQLPLAHSSLVEPCFLKGESISGGVRGQALQAVLHWAVDKLRPAGLPSWTASRWRHYNILFYFYLNEMRIAELADNMAIAEQTFYQLRPRAIAALGGVLREELVAPQHTTELKNYALADRYASHPPAEQLILRLATIFQQPIAANLLYRLSAEAKIEPVQPHLQHLLNANLLVANEQGTEFLATPEIRPYLLTLLSPAERHTWHGAAGEYYETQRDYLEAARHFRLAMTYSTAANVLIQHYREIIDALNIEELRQLLVEFRAAELADSNLWAELKIVDGQVAIYLEDVDTALARYGEALSAPDRRIKALAYCHRAEAFKLKNIDEALAHYHYGIKLLEELNTADPLLVKTLIELAWIFIQDRQDFPKAAATLQRAEELINLHDRGAWSDLHKAWGELCYRQAKLSEAIDHLLQSWLAANEVQDVDRMIKTAHNLGQFYVEAKQYEHGLNYLAQSQQLATQAGNRTAEAACHKGMGGCYFWQAQYERAIEHYQTAYTIFQQTGNLVWQASTCYDLAEVHAKIGETHTAKVHFEEGVTLAKSLGYEELLQSFDELAHQHGELKPPTIELNERQNQALEFIKAKGKITNRDYRQLTGISQKQAVRDLHDLVDKGILSEIGSGRATGYVIK